MAEIQLPIEWATAKSIHRWGELNLTIYGHCLVAYLPALPDGPIQSIIQSRNEKVLQTNVIAGMMASQTITPQCQYSYTCSI